ncbi:ArsR/SmtB family transcription factor [Flavilitoribacter nigricans]|uniref:ArsR family transcriptional regulator n=1 Tax=Flavilitoribacter nigricans (strain ATCC 23147 / DSM 23189 / NBRC 102662 / NCIMB 1420 / SS-2) TaxID=1122177 RepID=A0A2D0N1V7_FLAN2|nr:metalloregulator ArsR/SmtB family transcription factor [Flavilitoribacter nigricans]PHN02494.1 ArsR family transcriptional regulator [Flavilitoribacter nigricans DSM 23189 = NBRC 102662]
MRSRTFKDQVYDEISRIARAISNPRRLEIIDFIANGEKCVEDIARQTGMSIANASQHLQTLKKERLVRTEKKGVQVYYSLASREVYRAWTGLRDLTLLLSPGLRETVEQSRIANDFGHPLTLEQLSGRTDVCLLDVRPEDEFQKGHIPDAVSVPLAELEQRLPELPKDKLLIAYCRGMFCTLADEAVKLLQARGYQAGKIEISALDYELASTQPA